MFLVLSLRDNFTESNLINDEREVSDCLPHVMRSDLRFSVEFEGRTSLLPADQINAVLRWSRQVSW